MVYPDALDPPFLSHDLPDGGAAQRQQHFGISKHGFIVFDQRLMQVHLAMARIGSRFRQKKMLPTPDISKTQHLVATPTARRHHLEIAKSRALNLDISPPLGTHTEFARSNKFNLAISAGDEGSGKRSSTCRGGKTEDTTPNPARSTFYRFIQTRRRLELRRMRCRLKRRGSRL